MSITAPDLKWIDARYDSTVSIEGLPWFIENQRSFRRLPERVNSQINKHAQAMGRCPSGARVRFKTNSTMLKLKIKHGMPEGSKLFYPNLSSMATSGIDLFIGPSSEMRYWRTAEPADPKNEYEYVYFQNKTPEMRELTLYLPIYFELAELKIGIDANSRLLPPAPHKITQPIVFYGTSITQGACASRGSNDFVAQVGRELDADVVNLGFSSGGKCENVMADLLAEIPASVYVIDAVANMEIELMKSQYGSFVQRLQSKSPRTPIVLMTKVHFSNETEPEFAKEYISQHEPLLEIYKLLKDKGDNKLYLFDSGSIIRVGYDYATADGVHLNDSGMKMIADALIPFLNNILHTSACMHNQSSTNVARN